MLGEVGRVLHVTVLELVVTVVVVIALITATALVTARRGRTRPAAATAGARFAARRGRAAKGRERLRGSAHPSWSAQRTVLTEAVAEASSEAIRLRRALDTLPQAVLVTDERGETVFRNSKAVALIGSRHGDALAGPGRRGAPRRNGAGCSRGTGARAVRAAQAHSRGSRGEHRQWPARPRGDRSHRRRVRDAAASRTSGVTSWRMSATS